MIRHVVMWKFKPENKDENIEKFLNMLKALDGEIDEIVTMSVGRGVNNSEWDASLVMDVESIDALNRYKENPKHKAVSKFCSSIRIDRCAVDYEI